MENTLNLLKPASVYLPTEIIINLILSFIFGLIISLVYKKTHKGLSYSQSFMITNVFVSVIVCMVIMIIGNNLARAFALVGALSIIRFRTVVKDTKDTAYIFWSLASGMATGTGSYFLAVAGNPEAVAFLDQGAMDNNTRVEDNVLSYSASNQAVELAWASSETVSSVYLNGQGDYGLDIYASEAEILNTGYESLFYNTGPTALGFNCFMYQIDCDEGDET